MTTTEWPPGVIARYLTVGGATVDITEDELSPLCFSTCTGCGDYELCPDPYTGTSLVYNNEENVRERSLGVARTHSQAHAETCRAMATPCGAGP